MPEMMIDIPVKEVARIIKSMNDKEVETLTLLLTDEGSELLERKRDLEDGRLKFLSKEEIFDV